MEIFAIYTKDETKLIALFRNYIDANWFMQTTNESAPLELKKILIEEELDNIWMVE